MLRLLSLFTVIGFAATLAWTQKSAGPDYDLIRKAEVHDLSRWRSLDADSSHSYDMLELEIDYRVEEGAVPATGVASLKIAVEADMSILPFNAEAMQVMAVHESGNPLTYFQQNDTVYVQRPVVVGDTLTLTFTVSVPVIGSNSDVGYHVGWQHVFTFTEPYGSRRWYPCFDQPFDKFDRVTLAVNMPELWSLAANGIRVETTYPEPGRKREVYVHEYPISTYLVMICAGRYSEHYETVDGVDYRYFAFPQDSLAAAYDWERTPQMVALFNDKFGEYPFGEYGMVQAAIFNGWGAMEHQTFTTYGFNLVDSLRTFEYIVAHELAHMWFGDALSPVDFRNMWLNEGFATFGDALWQEHIGGQEHYRDVMADFAQYYFQEDADFRYAPYDPPPDHLFGVVIYHKSAYILHMLREQLLGDSLFFLALRSYVDAHRYGNVDTEDFISSVNGVAGMNLHWFFDQWIYQAGHPVLDVMVTHGTPEPNDVTVTVIQQQTNAPIYRLPISVDVTTQEGTFTRQFWFDQQTQSVTQSYGAPVVDATMSHYQPLLYQGTATNVPEPPPAAVTLFTLGLPYPNPFNLATRIPFELNQPAVVSLALYDLTGRVAEEVISTTYPSGRHELSFVASERLATGIYIVALEANGIRRTQKLLLLK